ncbi:hypothetical protein BDW42DRAFT_107330 [Aspergillus taichungensis]|uniref:Uncharacterized protein n=1 Tax=Aspergillus taichungensis TaxID=482145 RepID=A0A2J5HTR2_9EURO|nr:hypothetical protein BDW42DRAFT_107330 [Aspergillus taichungensis]
MAPFISVSRYAKMRGEVSLLMASKGSLWPLVSAAYASPAVKGQASQNWQFLPVLKQVSGNDHLGGQLAGQLSLLHQGKRRETKPASLTKY